MAAECLHAPGFSSIAQEHRWAQCCLPWWASAVQPPTMPDAPRAFGADADVVYSREIGVDLVLGKCSWLTTGAACTLLGGSGAGERFEMAAARCQILLQQHNFPPGM